MLDKIRAEIAQIEPYDLPWEKRTPEHIRDMALAVIDKYAEQEPCDDVVSRQAALKELKESAEHHANDSREEALLRRDRDIIRALPPVRPQEQTGEWILLDECANSGYYCSKCKKKLVKEGWSETVKKINFCPNCGARMVEPQESEDKE